MRLAHSRAGREVQMLGVVATIKVKPGAGAQFEAAVEAHRQTDYFKSIGRKMGEFMAGRPELLRLTEVE